jgi:HlyD family secretion protein
MGLEEKRVNFLGVEPRTTVLPRRRRPLVDFLVVMIGLGFLALFVWLNIGFLFPPQKVLTVRAASQLAMPGELASLQQGQVIFIASGWIEAEPFMTKVGSFIEGIVADLKVIDGQFVRRGELLAVIDDRNLRLEAGEVVSDLKAMELDFESFAEKERFAGKEIALVERRLITAQTELARLTSTYEMLNKSGEAIALIQKEDARLAKDRQFETCRELEVEKELAASRLKIVQTDKDSLSHKIKAKKAVLERKELDINRAIIRSPIDGIIQKVYVRVGQKIMLTGDNMDSSTVADIYDPLRLQVRVDVALACAGRLEVGMPTQVITDVLPEKKLKGVVTSVAGQADLAKNTLQAKVKIEEPNTKLRPEMLARVEFFSPPPRKMSPGDPAVPAAPGQTVRVFVPEKALKSISGGKAELWVVRSEGRGARAEKRQVVLGSGRLDTWREIKEGVMPNQEIIISDSTGLKDRARIDPETSTRE